ncbi:MAG TPA: CoA transferase, partial [Pyrinomonadaceae bacterium]|nr:CoA transferase [Pyrinomonadaceae bacterium]
RLMTKIGRTDLAEHPEMQDNKGRVNHEAEIDQAIMDWTLSQNYEDAYAAMVEAQVPSGPVYSIADIAKDEHYIARELFEEVEIEPNDTVKIPAVLPKLTETPGGTDWIGPKIGEHNEEIYRGFLEMSQSEYEELIAQEII